MHRRRGSADTAASLRALFGDSAFTTAQAEHQGISARRLALAVDAGSIRRLRRGLYIASSARSSAETDRGGSPRPPSHTDLANVTPSTVADPDDQLAVAHHRVDELRGRGIAAAVGDETAASAWALPHRGLTVPTIRVPRGSRVYLGMRHGLRIREAVAHEVGRGAVPMDRSGTGDIVTFRGMSLTSPLATARDISHGLPRYQAVALFGLAQRRHAEWLLAGDELMDPGDLTQALADPELRRYLGQTLHDMLSGSIRRQHWCSTADPRPETYLEAISWGRLTGWSLGTMTPQAWVRGASGRHYRVDVLIDGIAGEADGAVKYRAGDTLWKEKLRQEDIENGGTPVVRWTFAEAEYRPAVLLERWRRALRRHEAA